MATKTLTKRARKVRPTSAGLNNRFAAPLGVCVFTKPLPNRAQPINYPDYIFEVLRHAGVCHLPLDAADLTDALDQIKLLVTVGDQELEPAVREKLAAWVKDGGAWLSLAGVCGMNDVLGVEYAAPTYANWGVGASLHGEGYLKPADNQHPVLNQIKHPLHFFGGLAMQAKGARVIGGSLDSHQRGTAHDVLFENKFGEGLTLTLSVDVTGTIVRIQQGIAVTRDGVPAPDGTGPVTDAVLKSGDGCTLDWILDRHPVPGVHGLNIYLEPIADLWREVILKSVFHLATQQNLPLPVLWMYPRALPAIAHMSHDSDGNVPERAVELLGLLKQGQINSTWCIIKPGYDKKLMKQITGAGHELATHYDSMTGTKGLTWGRKEFNDQHKFLAKLFGKTPVTNKNHYLRWEGDTDFWEWCQDRNIEIDQSKGPSKTGEAGFNFGSCHPYLPVKFDGSTIDVLELATLTQDLVIFAPPAVVKPFIESTLRVHGIMHLLFHPAHVGKPGVNEAILVSIAEGKKAGMEWWTSENINSWERARRKVTWSNYSVDGASVEIRAEKTLVDATILWLNGKTTGKTLTAWGFEFSATQQTLPGKKVTQLKG